MASGILPLNPPFICIYIYTEYIYIYIIHNYIYIYHIYISYIYIYVYLYIWRFPKTGVPPNHGFLHELKHPAPRGSHPRRPPAPSLGGAHATATAGSHGEPQGVAWCGEWYDDMMFIGF